MAPSTVPGNLESRRGVGDFLQRALHRGLGHLVQAEQRRQQFPECGQLIADGHGLLRQQAVQQQAIGLNVDGIQLVAG